MGILPLNSPTVHTFQGEGGGPPTLTLPALQGSSKCWILFDKSKLGSSSAEPGNRVIDMEPEDRDPEAVAIAQYHSYTWWYLWLPFYPWPSQEPIDWRYLPYI